MPAVRWRTGAADRAQLSSLRCLSSRRQCDSEFELESFVGCAVGNWRILFSDAESADVRRLRRLEPRTAGSGNEKRRLADASGFSRTRVRHRLRKALADDSAAEGRQVQIAFPDAGGL